MCVPLSLPSASLSVCLCICVSVSVSKQLTMLFGVAQLDAAWMAASAGVSVVIASGKAKDGVLQVTAGVTLSANLTTKITVHASFHLFTHLAMAVCVPAVGPLVSLPVFSLSVCLPISLYVLIGSLWQRSHCAQGCTHIASQDVLQMQRFAFL